MTLSKILELPLIPLRDMVVFPDRVYPFLIGRKSSVKALEFSLNSHNGEVFLSMQKNPSTVDPKPHQIYNVGTLSKIIDKRIDKKDPFGKTLDETFKVLVKGEKRGRIIDFSQEKGFFIVKVELFDIPEDNKIRKEILLKELEKALKNSEITMGEYRDFLQKNKDLSLEEITNYISHILRIENYEKQQLLEIVNPEDRVLKIIEFCSLDKEKREIYKKIEQRVRKQMDDAQREYFLRERIKAIKRELGEENFDEELDLLEEKVKESKMPQDAREKALYEIKRLRSMPPMSAEAAVSRNYIDWLLNIPWGNFSQENKDIKNAIEVLEKSHYGLEEVKKRIIEHLAVRLKRKKPQGTILCLIGPPGVGKTSLGKSIAEAMGRKFVRLSLGGVKDEAEIKGHRRTYIGAFPGQIIQMLKRAGTMNPVMLLDEIDKLSSDFRGDPSSALLEVFDSDQNVHFLDHYIDTEVDLSKVFFITTANVSHTIPRPLLDRMEIIYISGYTEKEKLEIAKKYLIKKRMEATGLEEGEVEFEEEALLKIIREYTKESGVRNLEKEIGKICRRVVRERLERDIAEKIKITPEKVEYYLGPPKYMSTSKRLKNEIGVATGMSWTEYGGEILYIEVVKLPGKGELILTGQLGDVMKESAKAAMSYVRSRASNFGITPTFYKEYDFHIHVPEGAIPKDGPSAGIAITMAIISALAEIPIKKDVAMTGEITLTGKILPVGGIKEKLLAAHRYGIKNIILPEENKKDLTKLPEEVKNELNFHLVNHLDQVISLTLEKLSIPIKEYIENMKKNSTQDHIAN